MKSAEEGAPKWKEKSGEAKQRIDSLELRKAQSLRLAEYIVKIRGRFFIFGEIGLSPMLMSVPPPNWVWRKGHFARAIQKYLSCLRGPFCVTPFLHIIGVNADDDGEGSSQQSKLRLEPAGIESEDSSKLIRSRPLSSNY